MIRLAALSLPLLIAVASCAPTPGGGSMNMRGDKACFLADRVINFRAGASPSVYVKAMGGDVFEVQTTGYCPDLATATTVGFTPMMGGSDRLCETDSLTLNVAVAGAASNTCRARVIRKLSTEEVAALPSRYRP